MMTRGDIARLLATASAFDQRTIGDYDVLAWQEALGDLEPGDAFAAVTAHYRESTDRLMPADVRRLAIEARNRRHTERERVERARAIESGRDRSEDVAALVAAVAEALPKPDIHQRAVARARKERGHPQRQPQKQRHGKSNIKLPKPISSEVATLARQYLVDGWEPKDVAERLGIERQWCERLARRPETVAAQEKAKRAIEEALARQTRADPLAELRAATPTTPATDQETTDA